MQNFYVWSAFSCKFDMFPVTIEGAKALNSRHL